MYKRFLECGKIVTTHGVRGEVKVQPWADSPEYLLRFSRFYLGKNAPVEVRFARVHKNMLLLSFDGIDTLEQAVTLRGKLLYIDREDDPGDDDGEYFVQDLIGLEVSDADTGEYYGKLTDVMATGANDVYEITGSDGKRYLIPAIRDVVLQTDVDGGKMLIRPLKGLFDNAY